MQTAKKKKGSADYIDVYVGDRLRSIRKAAGMSQEMLGEMMGISFQQVQKYEKGTNRISSSRLYTLTKIFRCKFEDFFPPPEGKKSKYFLFDDRIEKILAICKEITEDDYDNLRMAVRIITKD